MQTKKTSNKKRNPGHLPKNQRRTVKSQRRNSRSQKAAPTLSSIYTAIEKDIESIQYEVFDYDAYKILSIINSYCRTWNLNFVAKDKESIIEFMRLMGASDDYPRSWKVSLDNEYVSFAYQQDYDIFQNLALFNLCDSYSDELSIPEKCNYIIIMKMILRFYPIFTLDEDWTREQWEEHFGCDDIEYDDWTLYIGKDGLWKDTNSLIKNNFVGINWKKVYATASDKKLVEFYHLLDATQQPYRPIRANHFDVYPNYQMVMFDPRGMIFSCRYADDFLTMKIDEYINSSHESGDDMTDIMLFAVKADGSYIENTTDYSKAIKTSINYIAEKYEKEEQIADNCAQRMEKFIAILGKLKQTASGL